MDESSEVDELVVRYGSPKYYQDVFHGIEFYDIKSSYRLLDKTKSSRPDKYESARQIFLRLLGQDKMVWQPTPGRDKNVEVSRLYREDKNDFIGIMRIRPHGFRIERRVQSGQEITFHMLMGRASLKIGKRYRILTRGHHANLHSRNSYAMKNLCKDETTYLVFKIEQN